MKKLIMISVFVIIGLLQVDAQETGDFELGGNIGLNIANVSDIDGQVETNSIVLYNIAASGEYYFSDRWGIKMKLIYDRKGWADGFITDIDDIYETDFHLNYITIPVMANWHFGSNRNWYLNFGPYLGFLVKAEDSELEMDVKDAFNTTDFGLAFGIGYKFKINENLKMFGEFDGQSGLTNIFENNSGDSVRNGRSSFNIGLVFTM